MVRRINVLLLLFLLAVSIPIVHRSRTASSQSGWPGPGNSGVVEGASLEKIPDDEYYEVTTDGAVIEGVDLVGCIVVTANNVVIRDSRITCPATIPAVWLREGAGLTVSGNTIRGTSGAAAAVQGSNMRVEANDIAGTADGIKLGSNTVVTGNWIHDLWSGQTPSGPTHNDGIQMQGGSNVLIQGNTISYSGPQANSAVFFKSDSGPISDVNVINNRLGGFGFTARCMNNVSDCRILENTFERDGLRFGPALIDNGARGLIKCNVWDDGAPLTENTQTCDLPGVLEPVPTTTAPPEEPAPTEAPATTEAPVETPAPSEEPTTSAPTTEAPAPPGMTPAPPEAPATTAPPTSSTVAPTSSTVAPTSSTVAPTSSTVAPTSSTVAPTSSTVAPTSSTVPPSGTTPTTAGTTPTTGATTPTTGATTPTTGATTPTTGATTPTTGFDLAQVDLSKVDLSQLDLSKLDLSKVDLSTLDLSKVDLSTLDLSKLDLTRLDLGRLRAWRDPGIMRTLLALLWLDGRQASPAGSPSAESGAPEDSLGAASVPGPADLVAAPLPPLAPPVTAVPGATPTVDAVAAPAAGESAAAVAGPAEIEPTPSARSFGSPGGTSFATPSGSGGSGGNVSEAAAPATEAAAPATELAPRVTEATLDPSSPVPASVARSDADEAEARVQVEQARAAVGRGQDLSSSPSNWMVSVLVGGSLASMIWMLVLSGAAIGRRVLRTPSSRPRR